MPELGRVFVSDGESKSKRVCSPNPLKNEVNNFLRKASAEDRAKYDLLKAAGRVAQQTFRRQWLDAQIKQDTVQAMLKSKTSDTKSSITCIRFYNFWKIAARADC